MNFWVVFNIEKVWVLDNQCPRYMLQQYSKGSFQFSVTPLARIGSTRWSIKYMDTFIKYRDLPNRGCPFNSMLGYIIYFSWMKFRKKWSKHTKCTRSTLFTIYMIDYDLVTCFQLQLNFKNCRSLCICLNVFKIMHLCYHDFSFQCNLLILFHDFNISNSHYILWYC